MFEAAERILRRAASLAPCSVYLDAVAQVANEREVEERMRQIDDATHAGWSVCGVGEAYEIADPARLTELAALAPAAWNSAQAPMVSIPLQRLSGRQLVLADATS